MKKTLYSPFKAHTRGIKHWGVSGYVSVLPRIKFGVTRQVSSPQTPTISYRQPLGASVKTDTTTIKLTDIETTGRNIINQATVCRHDRPTLLYFLFFPTAHFLKTIFRLTHIAHICKPHKPTHNQSLQKSAISHRTISIVVPSKTLNLRLS